MDNKPAAAPYTDSTIMSWGKYKGKALGNIPGDYFIFMYKNNQLAGQLAEYVKNNM